MFFNYGDALDIPFKDECFDAVTFGSVLHLFTETRQRRAIEEALRVLKAEGRLVIIEMLRTAKVALTYLVLSFFIFQTKAYWIRLLRENGLENIKTAVIGEMAIFSGEKSSANFNRRQLN